MAEDFKRDKHSELIRKYEAHLSNQESHYFDSEAFEDIINYYLNKGKLKEALQACRISTESYPFSIELLLLKAQIFSDLNKNGEALEVLEDIIKLQPNDPDVLCLRGNIKLDSELYDEAILDFEHALLFTSEPDEINYNIGIAYQTKGDYRSAIDYYKKTISSNIHHENALYELAFCLEALGELDTSLAYYEKFIDEDPYSEYAWYNLGIVLSKLNRFKDAVEAYEYAVAIDEGFSSAYFNMANALMSLDRYTEAIEAYKITIQREGASAETYYCIAEAYEKLEQYELAIRYFRKAAKIDPFYAEAWFGIGYCLSMQEKYHEAIHFINKALKFNVENADYWLTLAISESKVGNIVSSQGAFEEASQLNPSNVEVWLEWSWIYYEQGDYNRAIELILSGIDECPEDSNLYYRITAYLIAAGKYKQAFNFLENALVLNFENHKVLFEFFPKLETQKALFRIIDQYRKNNPE